MKHYLDKEQRFFTSCCLIFLCVFLVSCSKEVNFFSQEEAPKPFISHRGPFSQIVKPQPSPRRKRKTSYRPPLPENLPALNAKVVFLSKDSSNVHSVIKLPAPPVKENFLTKAESFKTSEKKAAAPYPPLLQAPSALPSPPPAFAESDDGYFARFEKKVKESLPPSPKALPKIPVPAPRRVEWNKPAPDKVFIPRPLDIVFVWDTSSSMFQHLTQFKKKFTGFLERFAAWDWKWMLTNSNHGGNVFFLYNMRALKGEAMRLEKAGKVLNLRYLSPEVPDYIQIFLDSLSLHSLGEYERDGPDGQTENVPSCDLPPGCEGDQEQPLKALSSAMMKNKSFFRPEADLAVVIASNSKQREENSDLLIKADEVIEQFKKEHGLLKRFKVYALIIQEGDSRCLNQNLDQQFWFKEGAFSANIFELSKKTGGKTFSICLPDYRALAESIVHSFSHPAEE